jgi:hypothetical protein
MGSVDDGDRSCQALRVLGDCRTSLTKIMKCVTKSTGTAKVGMYQAEPRCGWTLRLRP